jgi:hypothetical protein
MRIRFRVPFINFDADPDFYLIWIQVTKMMQILADPDPNTDDMDPGTVQAVKMTLNKLRQKVNIVGCF